MHLCHPAADTLVQTLRAYFTHEDVAFNLKV
jgi:hypothetical protein